MRDGQYLSPYESFFEDFDESFSLDTSLPSETEFGFFYPRLFCTCLLVYEFPDGVAGVRYAVEARL